jgi:D-alanyl-D-alanine carboxypeptidase
VAIPTIFSLTVGREKICLPCFPGGPVYHTVRASTRTNTKPSTHSWGIAIDLNPETNAQGTAGDMDAGVIEIFRGAGFKWGGDWEGGTRDPMHFQFCTGYLAADFRGPEPLKPTNHKGH